MTSQSQPPPDDRHLTIINALLPLLTAHRSLHRKIHPSIHPPPLIIGLSGVQGSGKTTLTTTLHRALSLPPYNLSIAIFSIDDLYLPHDQLSKLSQSSTTAGANSTGGLNPLLKYRGNPGTHDIPLGLSVLHDLKSQKGTKIPVYDKSKHNGAGDRLGEGEWVEVVPPVDVVVLEGWCVGFRALEEGEVERRWRASRERAVEGEVLGRQKLEDVLWVNEQLRRYHALWDQFSLLIHIDAHSLRYIPRWRLQQEHALHATRGTGMTDEQVLDFVNMYMPAYELYVPDLRQLVGRAQRVGEVTVGNGQSEAEEDNGNDYLYILHMVIGENREVIEVRVCRAERAE